MKSYKITPQEKEQLTGEKIPNGAFYNPVQDINGDWFIFEEEYKQCGLGVEAEFIPPPTDENII